MDVDNIKNKDLLEIEQIVNRIYNNLGYGLSEYAYQRAMEVEIQSRNYCCIREYFLNEEYKTLKGKSYVISQLRIDIVITDLDIGIELKTIARLTDKERNQAMRYHRLGKFKHTFLINFGKKLEIELIG